MTASSRERLSTPDQLDQVIQVAHFPHWLVLCALILVILTGVAASIWIPVPITVRGEGILINAGGILTVTSQTEGRLDELLVAPGDEVHSGMLVARVVQPEMWQTLLQHREQLAEAHRRRQTIQAFQRRALRNQQQTIADQRRVLEQRFDFATGHLRLLEDQLAVENELSQSGVIARRQVLATRTRIDETKSRVLGIEHEIKHFVQVESEEQLTRERELLEIQLEISELERQVVSLENDYRRNVEVRSPYGGRVVELKINPGEITERNGALFSLLPNSVETVGELIAVLYVPPAEGKKIRLGMEVQLALSSIKREEYGFMLGRVETVAEVPSTTEGMMRILQNRQLVEQLSGAQAPFEVKVRLSKDATSATGYRWSSSAGPDGEIHVGTFCTGDVITRYERPIGIVLPSLGRFFDD